MTRWRLLTSLVGAMVLILSVFGIATAETAASPANPCDKGAAEENNEHCEDGEFDPPCDEADEKDEPECQDDEESTPDPEPDPDEGCTEEDTDGLDGNVIASGAIAQASDELAANGAPAELTDGIDTLNCEVVVQVEQAIEGGGGELPPAPDPGGDPAPPASCADVVDGFADGGAPAELTDPMYEGCDALEGEGGDEPPAAPEPPALPDPGGDPAPPASCDDLIGALDDGGAPADLTGPLGEGCTALEEGIPTP